jgi:hypothetical protein
LISTQDQLEGCVLGASSMNFQSRLSKILAWNPINVSGESRKIRFDGGNNYILFSFEEVTCASANKIGPNVGSGNFSRVMLGKNR